jgi:SDR family mycofactocin-dependent oxidoreductase
MGRLDGRVALVTGGARGQGRSHALALAGEGAIVAVCDIADQVDTVPYPLASTDELHETVSMIKDLGAQGRGIVADVRDSVQVRAAVDSVVAEFGRLDILLANAGIGGYSQVEDMSDDAWHNMVETNLSGVFYSVRAALPHMRRNGFGRIVATSSGAGRGGMPNLAHYAAAKWGLIGFIKSVALETAKAGITANVVCPSTVGTSMIFNDATFRLFRPDLDAPTADDAKPRFAEHSPMGIAWLEPEEVTRAVMYFVTDSGFTSGAVLDVNLGTSATRT